MAGFDMRPLLRALPDARPVRDSTFVARIVPLIARARHELRGDSVPLIIAGHSLKGLVTTDFQARRTLEWILFPSPGRR